MIANLASVCACLSTVFLSHVTVCPWLIPECILINRITTQGKLCQTGTDSLDKKMLETDKCFLLDCGGEVFVWMGRQSSISERKISIFASEVRISSPSLPLPSENSHMKDRSLSCWGVSAWWEGKADQKGQWYNYLGKLMQRSWFNHCIAFDRTAWPNKLMLPIPDTFDINFGLWVTTISMSNSLTLHVIWIYVIYLWNSLVTRIYC
jgi:hypothetical protein